MYLFMFFVTVDIAVEQKSFLLTEMGCFRNYLLLMSM